MAYRKLKHRILTGSLNLLPPGEKLPEEDALELTNWRVDQAGQLRSRLGMLSQSGYMAGGICRTLYRRSPDTRFAQVGGEMYRSLGFNNYANIGAGFDGEPMGMTGYRNFSWLMNRGRQGKVRDGSDTILKWLPEPPAQPCTVAAGAQELKVISTFDAGETFVVTEPDNSTGSSDFSSNAHQGQSLHVSCDPPGVWQVKRSINLDLGIDGQQRADDRFRIWLYASQPSNISEITVAIDVNGGDFTQDYYFCTMPGPGGSGRSPMSDVAEAWSQVEMRRALDGSGLAKDNPALLNTLNQLQDSTDELRSAALEQGLPTLREAAVNDTPAFVRVGNTSGKDWSTAAAIRIQVKVLAATEVNFDAFDVIGGIDSSIEGDVEYFITFDTDDSHESNAGPTSGPIHLDKQFATLTDIPVSDDPQVTKRRVYRKGGSLNGSYRVGTINDNTSTTFPADGQRELTDEQAQSLNELMPTDHDPAPAAKGLIGPYFGKLIAYNTEAKPGRYFWTDAARPWYWPGSDDDGEGNWEDCGEESEDLYFVSHRKKMIIFYKRRSIWRLEGDPKLNDPERTNCNIGVLGPTGACNGGAVDYFASAEGIYSFNGDVEKKISPKVDPIFKGDFAILSHNADGTPNVTIPPMNQDYKFRSVLEFANGKLYFSYPSSFSTECDIALVCDLETLRWSQLKLDPGNNGAAGFSAIYYEGQDRALLGAVSVSADWEPNETGDAAAAVYSLGERKTDDGNAIPLVWHSRYNDMDLPDNVKVCEDLVIDYQTGDNEGSSGLTLSVYLDNGQTAIAVGTLNSQVRAAPVFRLRTGQDVGLRCRNIAVRIEGNATTECIVYGVYVHYYVEARLGKTFDTGVIDLGTNLAKQISMLEFDIEREEESDEDIFFGWYSDLPGGVMTIRQEGGFPLPVGRKVKEYPLSMLAADLVEGRKLRLIVWSDGLFRLHGVRARMRRIGEYADGTVAESWDSNEVGYGL